MQEKQYDFEDLGNRNGIKWTCKKYKITYIVINNKNFIYQQRASQLEMTQEKDPSTLDRGWQPLGGAGWNNTANSTAGL